MSWQGDKAWADKFLPEIKRILGEHLITQAPMEEDAEHNTDLIILKLDAIRIACRIRRYGYFEKYRDEFTIRSGRPNGCKTELAKIIEGWGDYFFYGFSNEDESGLLAWFLGDLRIFRLWGMRELARSKGRFPGMEIPNNDGSSVFRSFYICSLPNEFIVAKKMAICIPVS